MLTPTDYDVATATLDDAMELLGSTHLLKGREGGPPLPIPFGNLYGPIAGLIRRGGWAMRHTLLMTMAARQWLTSRPQTGGVVRSRHELPAHTPYGTLRIGTALPGHDMYAGLRLGHGVTHAGTKINLTRIALPDTIIQECLGRRIGDVIAIDPAFELSDARIKGIVRNRNVTTMWLDLREETVSIDDVAD